MKRSMNKRPAQKRSFRESVRRMFGKRFRASSYSAFAAVIVIAIAVIANMIAGTLPTSLTQLDLTSQSLYSLSDQTKRIAASLDKDVNLYLLATTGSEDETILRLLERYGDLSDHIEVSAVDPSVQPTFLDTYEFSVGQLYANSVIVDCDGRYRLVSYSDIYVTSYVSDSYSYYRCPITVESELGKNLYSPSWKRSRVYSFAGNVSVLRRASGSDPRKKAEEVLLRCLPNEVVGAAQGADGQNAIFNHLYTVRLHL